MFPSVFVLLIEPPSEAERGGWGLGVLGHLVLGRWVLEYFCYQRIYYWQLHYGRIWSQTWQCGSLERCLLLWLHLKVLFTQLIPHGTCLDWVIRTIPILRVWKRLLLFTTMVSQNLGCKLGLNIFGHFGPNMSIILMIFWGTVISWNHSLPARSAMFCTTLNMKGTSNTGFI